MNCPICNEKITIDDVELRFTGNQDIYGACYHCNNSLIIYIRFGRIWKYDYHDLINDTEFGLVENPQTETKTVIVNGGNRDEKR